MKMDKIYKALDCIRLRWHRTSGETGILSAARQFGSVLADAIRGSVHIGRRSKMMETTNEKYLRYQNHFATKLIGRRMKLFVLTSSFLIPWRSLILRLSFISATAETDI